MPDEALAFFRQAVARGAEQEQAWQQKFEAYRAAYPDLAAELERRLAGKLPEGWADGLPEFPPDAKGLASRASSGKVLNAIATKLPDLVGGSADLAPSTVTWMTNSPAFAADCREGRNFHFGVREHGMAAVVNGMAYHGGVIPFGATFFVFSDYLRPRCAWLPSRTWARSGSLPTTASAWAKMAPPTSRWSSWPRCARSPTWSPCDRPTPTRSAKRGRSRSRTATAPRRWC